MLNFEITLFPQSYGQIFYLKKKNVFRFLITMHYMVRVNLAKCRYSIARLYFLSLPEKFCVTNIQVYLNVFT